MYKEFFFWNAYTDFNGYEIALSTGTDQTLYIGGSSGSFATISNFCNWFDYKWHYVVVTFSNTTVPSFASKAFAPMLSVIVWGTIISSRPFLTSP